MYQINPVADLCMDLDPVVNREDVQLQTAGQDINGPTRLHICEEVFLPVSDHVADGN